MDYLALKSSLIIFSYRQLKTQFRQFGLALACLFFSLSALLHVGSFSLTGAADVLIGLEDVEITCTLTSCKIGTKFNRQLWLPH